MKRLLRLLSGADATPSSPKGSSKDDSPSTSLARRQLTKTQQSWVRAQSVLKAVHFTSALHTLRDTARATPIDYNADLLNLRVVGEGERGRTANCCCTLQLAWLLAPCACITARGTGLLYTISLILSGATLAGPLSCAAGHHPAVRSCSAATDMQCCACSLTLFFAPSMPPAGAFGVVEQCHYLPQGRHVAVKRLKLDDRLSRDQIAVGGQAMHRGCDQESARESRRAALRGHALQMRASGHAHQL